MRNFCHFSAIWLCKFQHFETSPKMLAQGKRIENKLSKIKVACLISHVFIRNSFKLEGREWKASKNCEFPIFIKSFEKKCLSKNYYVYSIILTSLNNGITNSFLTKWIMWEVEENPKSIFDWQSSVKLLLDFGKEALKVIISKIHFRLILRIRMLGVGAEKRVCSRRNSFLDKSWMFACDVDVWNSWRKWS